MPMRIIGIVSAFNEQRLIRSFLERHIAQGIDVYLIDNSSTDRTVDISREYLGKGLIGMETLPRNGFFDLNAQLRRKEELALSLPGDWFIHLAPDEMIGSPWPELNLASAIARVDASGYNAVNFLEFTFVPTLESPDHEHDDFTTTMRWYYPFLPQTLRLVRAWKKQPQAVGLQKSGGHQVEFPGKQIYPLFFPMRHYQFLSVRHAVEKYSQRHHPPQALARGFHGWREALDPNGIRLLPQDEFGEAPWGVIPDPAHPRARHVLDVKMAGDAHARARKQAAGMVLVNVAKKLLRNCAGLLGLKISRI
jgi:hypothetical protein